MNSIRFKFCIPVLQITVLLCFFVNSSCDDRNITMTCKTPLFCPISQQQTETCDVVLGELFLVHCGGSSPDPNVFLNGKKINESKLDTHMMGSTYMVVLSETATNAMNNATVTCQFGSKNKSLQVFVKPPPQNKQSGNAYQNESKGKTVDINLGVLILLVALVVIFAVVAMILAVMKKKSAADKPAQPCRCTNPERSPLSPATEPDPV